jgi:hypothetical protein
VGGQRQGHHDLVGDRDAGGEVLGSSSAWTVSPVRVVVAVVAPIVATTTS